MRLQRTFGLLSNLRSICSERSILLTENPTLFTPTSVPWQGSSSLRKYCSLESAYQMDSWHLMWKILLFGSTAITLGLNGNVALADDPSRSNFKSNSNQGDDHAMGLRRVEDGSVISNSHTIKWRIFTDKGRELFLKGKLDEAERYFQSALHEAMEGFGPRDAHVASACNNLAEIYRARKSFDKAEPLYLEAINILEESFGSDDIRVGATLHNLGQFYFSQRKVEKAQKCYEGALKIEGRVLGYGHTDYANTMYHLGMVLYLQGKVKDSEVLLRESIRIIEENGLGETNACLRRMQFLTKMLLKSERQAEAECFQRKILHISEISKGWNFMETILAAEGLAMILQSLDRLDEAQELLERCLDAKKNILPHDDIQMAANMLYLGKMALLKSNHLRQKKICDARCELDKAKSLLDSSIRIAKQNLRAEVLSQSDLQGSRKSKGSANERKFALILLLQSLDYLGLVNTTKSKMAESEIDQLSVFQCGVEDALQECITIFQEASTLNLLLSCADVRKEYLSCLSHLMDHLLQGTVKSCENSKALEDLMDCAQRIKAEILSVL